MVSANINILGSSLRNQLLAIQKTQGAVDVAQQRLASGRRVNSALDNPQNFFAAHALNSRAGDLQRLLDSLGQNLQTIKAADNALKSTEQLLNQADSITDELYVDLTTQQKSLNEIILEDNPDAYWRLNETSGNIAVNLGSGGTSIDGTYDNTVELDADPLYIGSNNDVTASFPGGTGNNRVSIPDSPLINTSPHSERTVELVFNTDDNITDRQVLYEEGGALNAFSIYIEDGLLYVNGRDAGAWGPVNINAEIEAGETYHVAFVFDFPNATFTGYLNSEVIGEETVNAIFPNHTANIGIGGMNGDSYFHDGSQNGINGFNFKGRIGEVALYNKSLSQEDIQARFDSTFIQQSRDAENQLNAIRTQIDELIADAHYRGTNMLEGDDLISFFNESHSSSLTSEGDFLDSAGLGISEDSDFNTIDQIETTLTEIREALEKVRSFSTTLATDFNVIKTRENFTEKLINELNTGADKLTLADQNKEGAKLVSLQVRQQIQFSVLGSGSSGSLLANLLT